MCAAELMLLLAAAAAGVVLCVLAHPRPRRARKTKHCLTSLRRVAGAPGSRSVPALARVAGMATTPTIEVLRSKLEAVLPGVRKDLEDLVRIESVSADPERAGDVRRSAEAVAA